MYKYLKGFKIVTELFISGSIFLVLMAGCGGGGGSGAGTSADVAATGVVFPIVSGMAYKTSSASGVVDAAGSYNYTTGENVSFSVGGIELASIPADSVVTPLPLNDDTASINLLRLLKALDTDSDLSNGISLIQVTPSALTSVDLTSESAVVAALATLSSTATLPAANDAQVASMLAAAKSTAFQNLKKFGSTYNSLTVYQSCGQPSTALLPADAQINFTAQPDFASGVLAAAATLTLSDSSTVNLAITGATGTFMAAGNSFDYTIFASYSTPRIINMLVRNTTASCNTWISLRDGSQANTPPIAGAIRMVQVPTGFVWDYSTGTYIITYPYTYTFDSVPPAAPGGFSQASKDTDGVVVSQSWSSSKGKTATGNYFSEKFCFYETGSVTLTVTDDEGATTTKVWTYGPGFDDSKTCSSTPGPAPTVTGIFPTAGPVGTEVTITGANFATTTSNAVMFNGALATVTVATSTSIVVTVPASATTGTVSVTTADGTATSIDSFTVTATPGTSTLTLSSPYKPGGFSALTYDDSTSPINIYTSTYFIYTLPDGTYAYSNLGTEYNNGWTSPMTGPSGETYWIGIVYFVEQASGKQFVRVYGGEFTTTLSAVVDIALSGADSFYGCELGVSCVGITVNRSTGEVSFLNTPMKSWVTDSTTGLETMVASYSMTGTLKLPPF